MKSNWSDEIAEASLYFACFLASQSNERVYEMKKCLPVFGILVG